MVKVTVNQSYNVAPDTNKVLYSAGVTVELPEALRKDVQVYGDPTVVDYPTAQLGKLASGSHTQQKVLGEELVAELLRGVQVNVEAENLMELRQLIADVRTAFQKTLRYVAATRAFTGPDTTYYTDDGTLTAKPADQDDEDAAGGTINTFG